MKVVEKVDATGTLAEYATNIQNDPVIVTDQGSPVAALVPLENTDLETTTRLKARMHSGIYFRVL